MSASSDDSLGSWKEMEDIADLDELIDAVSQKYPGCSRLLKTKDTKLEQSTAENDVNMPSSVWNTVLNLRETEDGQLSDLLDQNDPDTAKDDSERRSMNEEEVTHENVESNANQITENEIDEGYSKENIENNANKINVNMLDNNLEENVVNNVNRPSAVFNTVVNLRENEFGQLNDLVDPDDPDWIPSKDDSEYRTMDGEEVTHVNVKNNANQIKENVLDKDNNLEENAENAVNRPSAVLNTVVNLQEIEFGQLNDILDPDDPDWIPSEDDSEDRTMDEEEVTLENVENSANQINKNVLDQDNLEENFENTLGKIKKTRRRKASRNDWHDNIQIKLREQGKGYVGWSRPKNAKGKRGTEREGRKLGPTCNSKFCKKATNRQCQAISEQSRTVIFTNFWETMSWDQKKIYVISLIKKVTAEKSKGENSRRKFTFEYNLKSTDGNTYPVCKNMFLNTLGLKEWSVANWVNNSEEVGTSSSTENVLKSQPARKVRVKEGQQLLQQFLDDLPKLPSHYCRQSSQKVYLEPMFGSTMNDVFKAYLQFCAENGDVKPVSRFTFDKVILEKKICIQLPKKDKCDLCCMYEVKTVDEETYNSHIQQKQEARDEKGQDKKGGEEGNFVVLTQDVQSVKVCPSLNASALYFKTKLCNHNFTIYDVNKKNARCYWFTEADADLTANTFTSCIIDYLSVFCDGSKPIILWSDGCTYQNRNAIVSNALLAFSVENKVEIYQKYLVKGHTQMEADSVHAAIERKLRNKPIYLPNDYLRYTVEATNEEKYDVKQLSFDFVKDYSAKSKLVYDSIRPGKKPGDPTVNDIKVIKYSPDGNIQVKINSFSSEFFDLPQRRRLQTVPRLQDFNVLRAAPIKISKRKWLDLQELKKVIPLDCHAFYDNLAFEEK